MRAAGRRQPCRVPYILRENFGAFIPGWPGRPAFAPMKSRSVKRLACPLSAILCLLLLAGVVCARGAEREQWTSVQTRNFLLVGNASERDMRKVAGRLEQFREAFLRLLPVSHFDSSVPLTVIVFRDDTSSSLFEPLFRGGAAEVVGFFQSGPDVDYIALSLDRRRVRSADALAFHEYVHLLVRNGFGSAPLWFNEGLADYYSTFDISDGNRKVTLGKPAQSRVQSLRGRELIPLETLLRVEDNSPYYQEPDKRSLFYAESWALVHYLLSGERRLQLSTYLELLAKGAQTEDAFRQAFQTDFATLENELRLYIQQNKYPRQVITFGGRVELDAPVQSAPLTEAEAEFYLGDLLLHADRHDEAAARLRQALALDPNLAAAHASLGVLLSRRNQFDEALKHLERAAEAGPRNYLAHYYRASVLSRDGRGADGSTGAADGTETARLIRAELRKTIELAPNFAEAYRLLAFVNLTRGEQLDESIELLKRAMALSPRRQEFALLLAQVHLRREDFQAARDVLNPLAIGGAGVEVRSQAQSLLAGVASREEYAARLKALSERAAAEAARQETPPGVLQPCDAPQPGPQLKKLRFSGEQVCGQLVRVECDEKGVLLVVEAGGRTLRLRKDSLHRIRFVTYTAEVRGEVTCGERAPANHVLVTYRPAAAGAGQADGEVTAVEFMPREWNAN